MFYAKIRRKSEEEIGDFEITISEDPPTRDELPELERVLQAADEETLNEKVLRYIENELKDQPMIT